MNQVANSGGDFTGSSIVKSRLDKFIALIHISASTQYFFVHYILYIDGNNTNGQISKRRWPENKAGPFSETQTFLTSWYVHVLKQPWRDVLQSSSPVFTVEILEK